MATEGASVEIEAAFGMAVRLRRTELKLSQEALAVEAAVARSFLSAVERGAKQPTVKTVWKLSRALSCMPSDIWKTAEWLYLERY
tara:strand:+ start:837 stop:1091 length:255 start_codon:yes stop_codon:yes gene_type:complete